MGFEVFFIIPTKNNNASNPIFIYIGLKQSIDSKKQMHTFPLTFTNDAAGIAFSDFIWRSLIRGALQVLSVSI